MAAYYVVAYDNEASGPFVAEGVNLTWTGGVGFVVSVIDNGLTGLLYIALVSGPAPADNDVLTQGTTTADANGAGTLIAYPAYYRRDHAVAGTGAITWTGPVLGVSHSFKFKSQTSNVVAGEILTFFGSETCEVITVVSDAGTTGELHVRFTSFVDVSIPGDNVTFTGDLGGDGTVDGVVHDRAYVPLHTHRFLQDLNDNSDISGDDDLSRVDPIASGKDTPEIVNLLGVMNISDVVAQHMYGGSIAQASGATLYSGLDVQVTSPNVDTQPILIQNDSIITDYWKNAYNPDSIKGKVRMMVKTRQDGVDFDGRRIKGKLSEFGDSNFIGGTTLGLGATALALFSSNDGNNNTAVGTVAGAPYNTIVVTEGFQSLDFNNGNGATPYGLSIDFGSASSSQTYERTKYIQRRGTAELLFGRDATFFDGINLNMPYDTEVGGPFIQDEVVVWGTVMSINAQAAALSLGEVVTFSGGSRGRLLYINVAAGSGTLIFDMDGNPFPATTETLTGITSGGDGTLTAVGTNTRAGTAMLVALEDNGLAGNFYCSNLTGVLPVLNSEMYGSISDASAAVSGTIATRTINNQFIGVYTGTNFQTNFGIAIDPTDAIVGDQLPNLLGAVQQPPNNQIGVVTDILPGDTVTVFPWDGIAVDVNGDAQPNFSEMLLATALTAASTTVNVGVGNIPDNTPAVGSLRIQRDSDGNLDILQYSAHDGNATFTLVGTAPGNAAIGNTTMRGLVDTETIGTNEGFTSVFGPTSMQVAITVQNGYTAIKNGPIKPFKTTATYGASGFSVGAVRTSDA